MKRILQQATNDKRVIVANDQDELDSTVDHYKGQGWFLVRTVRRASGEFEVTMERS